MFVFYSIETAVGLLIACLPVFLSVYTFFVLKKHSLSLGILLIGAFMLRLFFISLDPYLNDWDEKFHALVAKNLMAFPLQPMLYSNAILPYDYTDWTNNYIWLHKQPLFLWQSAFSMKIFGVSAFAFRIPSAIMGTVCIWLTFDIAKMWLKDVNVAYIAALLLCTSYTYLEHISGRLVVDHNDIAFSFYGTIGIWAFVKYALINQNKLWAMLIGVFVGAAFLNKWLFAFIIYLLWLIWLLSKIKSDNRNILISHLMLSVLVAILIAMPWQLYCYFTFPKEFLWELDYNGKHFYSVVEGHKGSFLYHFFWSFYNYGVLLFPFSFYGGYCLFKQKQTDKIVSIALMALVLIVYLFFSLAQTKMPTYTWFINALVTIVIAVGIVNLFGFLKTIISLNKLRYLFLLLFTVFLIDGLKPTLVINKRSKSNDWRNEKIAELKQFKIIESNLKSNSIIFNCTNKYKNNIDAMFHTNAIAYRGVPDEKTIDSLQQKGYNITCLNFKEDNSLPNYVLKRKDIEIFTIKKE